MIVIILISLSCHVRVTSIDIGDCSKAYFNGARTVQAIYLRRQTSPQQTIIKQIANPVKTTATTTDTTMEYEQSTG